MEISAEFAADLNALGEALDEPGANLESLVRRFDSVCSLAVESYLGFSVKLVVGDYPVDVTVLEEYIDESEITTSAHVPLHVFGSFQAGSVITFYAGTPGAFVDFAADLAYALRLDPGVLELDNHLTPPALRSGVGGLVEMAAVNRAMGILIDRGHTPEGGIAELHRLAELDHITPHEAAQRLIDATRQPPPT
jgi:hypothetical protein